MGAGSSFLVFFAGEVTLDDAERALARSMTVTRDGDALLVRWHATGPQLVVALSEAPHVVVEAQEIAEYKQVPELAECDRRFEVLIDDLESVLDETNTLIETQLALQDLCRGYIFLTWNGELMPPQADPDDHGATGP